MWFWGKCHLSSKKLFPNQIKVRDFILFSGSTLNAAFRVLHAYSCIRNITSLNAYILSQHPWSFCPVPMEIIRKEDFTAI